MGNEFGFADKKFIGADNVKVDSRDLKSMGPIGRHSGLHSNSYIWRKYIEPRLKK